MQEELSPMSTAATPDIIRRYFITFAIVWTLLITGLFIWGVDRTTARTDEILLSQARPFFKQIVITRSWNARHGGVYVPISSKDLPNPYLNVPDRDIETKDGMRLTLINPAYMTRQIAELALQEDNIIFHLTSDRPIRPANAAKPWELKAIQGFKSKGDEFHERWTNERNTPFFRYMAPVWIEKPCLKCHAQHGYREGDLRGGLSVTIPAQTVINKEQESIAFQGGAFALIWLLGLAGLAFASHEIGKRSREQETLIQRLENTLQGLVPICASCKNICDEGGNWVQLERYISSHSEAEFSHGICPSCARTLYPKFNGNGDS